MRARFVSLWPCGLLVVACSAPVTSSARPTPSGGGATQGTGGANATSGATSGGASTSSGGALGSSPPGLTNAGGSSSNPSSSGGANTLPTGGSYHADGPPDFGPNVLLFDPTQGDAAIQARLDQVFTKQETNQFGSDRYAYFFAPGSYHLDVNVGFYTEVVGLGATPDDVSITGAVRSMAKWFQGNATQNFWRLAENFAVNPSADINPNDVWAVSQATALRRVHVTSGGVNLFDPEGGPNEWASGGFIADSLVDGTVVPGSQQQFLTRNVSMQQWVGGVWNMVFVGNEGDPSGAWPASPYTFVDTTPAVREKPYLTRDSAGNYSVQVPPLEHATRGPSWAPGSPTPTALALDSFYVARSDRDTADTIASALAAGANLILTPGVYHLSHALSVTRPGSVVLGIGLATLIPDAGTPAIEVADVDGVTIAGVLFDAGLVESPTLLQLGSAPSALSHAQNPSALFDISCRVGGVNAGVATSCVTIDSNDVQIDNAWLWRADHGNGVGWDSNRAKNGLIVNGARVSAYGLFVEHFEEYQTLWNGENGRIYFYQSEIPYDVPSQARWTHDGKNGYASLKIADNLTTFDGRGLGIYCYFDNNVVLDSAIESPTPAGVTFQHIVTQWFTNAPNSAINHILNDTGNAVNASNPGATE